MKILKPCLVCHLHGMGAFFECTTLFGGDAYKRNDHFGHYIFPMSFTVIANIDMRTGCLSIGRSTFRLISSYSRGTSFPDESTHQFEWFGSLHRTPPSGEDGTDFTIATSDPDGSGPLNVAVLFLRRSSRRSKLSISDDHLLDGDLCDRISMWGNDKSLRWGCGVLRCARLGSSRIRQPA